MKGTLQEAFDAARSELNQPKDLLYMERPDLTEDERKLLDKLLGKSIVDELKTNKVLATLKEYTHGFGYPIEIINDDTEYPSHISDYTIQTISSDRNNIVIDKVVSSDIDYEDMTIK